MADEKAVTIQDTITPIWADKGFILVAVHVVAFIVAAALGIHLNEPMVAADATIVLGFIAAHKGKTAYLAGQIIKGQIQKRYTTDAVPLPADAPLADVAKGLDNAGR